MLFIFRQLRRSFFLPGKLRTYLAYAIGEILLIVIGILIAVQIGDWQDARKLDRQRLELIENLKVDFQTNVERLDASLEKADIYNPQLLKFLQLATVDNRHLTVDELKLLAVNTFLPIRFRAALGTYQSARDDGSFSLIADPALTELFINFEESYAYYLTNQNLDRETVLTGEAMTIRRSLGSIAVVSENRPIEPPEAYRKFGQEYRDMIAREEIYGFFELMYQIKMNQQLNLEDARKTSKQILSSLNEL